MPIDPTTAYNVRLGTWTDWSRGPIYGATLTLARPEGNLLIAFVALFVAYVSTRSWRLACLIFHYINSDHVAGDGASDQHPVFLGKASGAEGSPGTLTDIGLSLGKIGKRVWRALLPISGMALAFILGFFSRIATFYSGEVLLSGANCGVVQGDGGIISFSNTQGPLLAQEVAAAESYARQCYASPPIGAVRCDTYVRKQLYPSVMDTNASCPFDGSICKRPNKNLLLDTGLLDTHDDFGRNSQPNRRLQYRRTLHCGPLATDGYRFRTYNTQNESFTAYYYGPLQNTNGSTLNHTARFSNDMYTDLELLTRNDGDSTRDFNIRYVNSAWHNGSISANGSSFFPIAELQPQNADIYLFFLTSGHLLFGDPIQDDWYHAVGNTTRIHKLQLSDWGNATVYRQSEPGSPLACREQHQYCYQNRCTSLGSDLDSQWALYYMADGKDREWINWLMRTGFLRKRSIWGVLAKLRIHALIARDNLNGPVMGTLPDNQWQLEVQHWHAISMAHLQGVFLDSVLGHSGANIRRLLRNPRSPIERNICANQKILSRDFISINILGLGYVFVLGNLIIWLSFALDTVLSTCSCVFNRGGRHRYAKVEIPTDDAL